jgi:hypothetical protein
MSPRACTGGDTPEMLDPLLLGCLAGLTSNS